MHNSKENKFYQSLKLLTKNSIQYSDRYCSLSKCYEHFCLKRLDMQMSSIRLTKKQARVETRNNQILNVMTESATKINELNRKV